MEANEQTGCGTGAATEKKACCTPENVESRGIRPESAALARAPGNGGNRRGMVELPGGAFTMGSNWNEGYPGDGEGPAREVTLRPFYMSPTTVTNQEFAKFVKATGFKTEAEAFGWSFVFHLLVPDEIKHKLKQRVGEVPWWLKVPGAHWRRPEGRGTQIKDRMDHPVVHVTWSDAMAYCAWAKKRLPTEAEYEYAARGGVEQQRFPWGDELEQGGEHHCNVFQGVFPDEDLAEDGYAGTAPARSYKPNGFGMYNVAGNVWEWCWDWFSTDFHAEGPREDPAGPPDGDRKVMRGGSYLCHESYCNRYRSAARTSNTPDSSTGNMGFRCAVDIPE